MSRSSTTEAERCSGNEAASMRTGNVQEHEEGGRLKLLGRAQVQCGVVTVTGRVETKPCPVF